MSSEAHLFALITLPHPWPPTNPFLLFAGEANGLQFQLVALPDSRIQINTPSPTTSFISQPIDLPSGTRQWAVLELTLTAIESGFLISGQRVRKDAPNVERLLIEPISGLATPELSIHDTNASNASQQWIKNRKDKFAQPYKPRKHRRPKTKDEQANDLRASIYRLNYLKQQVTGGYDFLLGTLAGELRASIYWARPAVRDDNYNPLLLRMASWADLPLPVYAVPKTVQIPTIPSLQVAYEPGASGLRIFRLFTVDQVCDLQESLESTVIQLGPTPGVKTSTGLNLIKELAHTMGAAHYDEDASDFLDVLSKIQSAQGDHVKTFMCQTADAVASLSEWVLSELKTRSLIG